MANLLAWRYAMGGTSRYSKKNVKLQYKGIDSTVAKAMISYTLTPALGPVVEALLKKVGVFIEGALSIDDDTFYFKPHFYRNLLTPGVTEIVVLLADIYRVERARFLGFPVVHVVTSGSVLVIGTGFGMGAAEQMAHQIRELADAAR
jgi:hypothetical protein